jgi:hypothetical protein
MKLVFKVLDYLRYPSTWKGLVTIATAAGMKFSDVQAEALIAAGLAVIGLIDVFYSESDVNPK